MISLTTFQTDPDPCSYLPDRQWSLVYKIVLHMTPEDYQRHLDRGWRRFGHALFRPRCPQCQACLSLRIPVATFRPNRSQRRCWNTNVDQLTRRITTRLQPAPDKLHLYQRYHEYQHHHKHWPNDGHIEQEEYVTSFQQQLLGVGYVDRLPLGLSAIYFFYDPDFRSRSLGTFHILSLIAEAQKAQLPYVYLGYYVAGCPSLEYKARFQPNEVFDPLRRTWIPFQPPSLLSEQPPS
jgi:arginyl-tRNA--protein-N-Asp/Glu arginylyltransferase